jgi:ABC-type multidrug transport system fused ATPase/permease subunit
MRTAQTELKKQKNSKKSTDPLPEGESKAQKLSFWKTLFPYLKPYTRHIVVAIVLSVLTGIGVALQPFMIKFIIDTGVGDAPIAFFGKELFRFDADATREARLVFVAAAALAYFLLGLMRVSAWRVGLSNMLTALEGAIFTLRSRFFGHVQRMCMRFYDKNSSGELYNYIMGSPMANIKTYLQGMVQSVPYQAVSLVISLLALFSYNWKLTLMILVTSIVMVTVNRITRGIQRRNTQAFLNAERDASEYITDALHGSEAIKMYSIESDTIVHFEGCIENLKRSGIRYTLTSHNVYMLVELLQYLGIAGVYLLGGYLCLGGELAVGEFYLFLSTMTTILGVLTSWINIAVTHHSAAVALERVDKIIKQHSTTPEVKEDARRAIAIEKDSAMRHGKPCIAFHHVKFAYDDKSVFEDLSCSIGYRESIGLVGGSGSGKSTFTKLIMRLYEVDGGEIRVHDRNVKDFETHELRLSFGVVPQNPFIFHGTIWDNIRIVRPEATNKEIIDAMEIARVHEFVNELPMGWSTVIGDGALGLSGGQKQRIAIARAVLKKPDVFIFDEATSALDNVSEALIQQAMEELMKSHTVIFVAHRLSTIRNVDRILVFDHGNIVEEGSYDELAARDGEFKKLLDAANSVGGLNPISTY